jgi:hypothetical protein
MNDHHVVPTRRTGSPVGQFLTKRRGILACLCAGILPVLIALLSQANASAQGVIVPYSNVWKFEQSNIDLGTAWKEPGFDDTTIGWGSGRGPLGFNGTTTNEALLDGLTVFTLLNRTTNGVQPRTYYFRTTFVYSNDPRDVTLVLSNLIDDAAVFWLNGVEIGRPGFNAGTVVTFATSGDRAAADVGSYGYDVITKVGNLIQGTNTLAVEVHQTGNNSSDLVMASRVLAIPGTPIVITQQPMGGSFDAGRGVAVSVTTTGSNPRYQWYKGTNSPTIVPNATNRSLIFTNIAPTDSGDYFVIVTNLINSATSQVAHLEVVPDVNGPLLLKVAADDSFVRVILTWDEPVLETSAIEVGNYRIFDLASNEFTIASVVYNGSNVVLNVPTLAADSDYWIEIDFQTDNLGNPTLASGTPEIDSNGITRTIHTWVYTPGLARFQAYLATTSIPLARSSPLYPNSGSFGFLTNVVNWPQTANPNIENYVMRFDGLFVATESGQHRFNPSHDDEMELRVYPGPDTNGVPTVFSEGCCNDLIAGGTLDVTLTAGQRYYFELLVHEGGGGDYAGIAVTLPSTAVVSPISGQYLAVATDPTLAPNAGISLNPQSLSIEENHTATFQVTATNTGGSVSYQWQLNAGTGFTNIPGASSVFYTTPVRTIANSGDQYRAIVYVPGRTMVSSAATLTVVTDTHAPHVLRVTTGRLLTNIVVAFDEVMDPNSTGEPSNYELRDSGGNVITLNSPTMSPDNTSVSFTTVPLTLGATYTLHVQDISDAAGLPIATVDIPFQAGRGLVKYEVYATGAGNAVADLRAYAGYPNSPRETGLLESFNSDPYWGALVNTDPTRESYGARISGWFIPPVTTNYIFYNASDDASELLLSTDNTAANAVKIQEELACCNGFSSHPSAPIPLVAGNPYYIELLYKEGTGGDFGSVAVKQAGDPTSPDSLGPIPAAFLTAVDPTPPPARLNYTRTGNIVTLSWEAPYRLQVATTFTPTPNWKDVDTAGGTTYIADPANEFDVFLDAAQSGGGARTGSGSGTVTFSGSTLAVDVSYSGLSGTRSDDHFHAPAVRGANASVVYGLASITTGSQAGTIKGNVTLVNSQYGGKTIAQQVQDIRDQLWYLNIHTSTFGGGEIRGQVEPAKTRFYRLVKP